MPFRSEQPFGKIRLALRRADGSDCGAIEVLGDGQQFVVEGLHATTKQPYSWSFKGKQGGAEILASLSPSALPLLTIEIVRERLLPQLRERLALLGITVIATGSGRTRKSGTLNQENLRAPSLDAIREAVALIPNDNLTDRATYIKMGFAIKAAAGPQHEAQAFDVYVEWCSRWEGGFNEPETVRRDWESMQAPFELGWSWIEGIAREHGFNSAALDFEADPLFVPDPLPPPPSDEGYTDMGNGGRFARRYRHEVRFVPGRGWFCYDGKRWMPDTGAAIMRRAKQVARDMLREAADKEDDSRRKELITHARRSEADARLRAMLAQAQPELTVPIEVLDSDPMLFNVLNGTIDLRTGSLLQHDPQRLITKLSPVAYYPDAKAPLWCAFLDRVFAGDADTIAFFQRAVGYSMTGDTSEQVFFVAHGCGQNGKSVAFGIVERVLADYAFDADFSTFVPRKSTGPRNDLAAMVGARFVAAMESEAGDRLDESVIKRLTGGDPITARFLHKEYFTFKPQAKIWLVSNFKPTIRGTDFAMWRRVRLVPFAVTIPEEERNLNLPKELEAELPGILAWMVKGALAWQHDGLGTAPAVLDATAGYRAESDTLARFLQDRCLTALEVEVGSPDLYSAYSDWCRAAGEMADTQRDFNERLAAQDPSRIRRLKTNGGKMIWRGVELLPASVIDQTHNVEVVK
jgi:putative DNA primase/helicase